ncbi:MAG: hypothetical protein ISP01_05300 [Methanobrevibacter arboriphilus]|uniref:Uncharacterized protein n=1 Tax=Methanobrevibacter arboriphilus TaxID=39441 RepID=A0A843ADL9_METAZ|nr:hypothetical protein [Methanobrevibacter arboriphilus]MBF4468804.1 hypothetical protein [Methanobrevibacter arboriphilus]
MTHHDRKQNTKNMDTTRGRKRQKILLLPTIHPNRRTNQNRQILQINGKEKKR